MTYAPQTLLDARHVYQDYTGLSDVEVGIVGDKDHDGGYHQGWDNRRITNGELNDYSWEESSRDWNHKTNAASAIDFGWFEIALGGSTITLIDFNLWIVQELNVGAPDSLDVREFIYTPDGVTVKRWDRLKKRTSGDKSHLTHSHMSRFRDAEKKALAPFINRFFLEHGMSEWHVGEGTGPNLTQGNPGYAGHQRDTALAFAWENAENARKAADKANEAIAVVNDKLDQILTLLAQGGGSGNGDFPDSVQVVGGQLIFGTPEE